MNPKDRPEQLFDVFTSQGSPNTFKKRWVVWALSAKRAAAEAAEQLNLQDGEVITVATSSLPDYVYTYKVVIPVPERTLVAVTA